MIATQTDFIESPDICQNRHGGNEESRQAFEALKPSKKAQQTMVLGYIKNAGTEGLTCHELASKLGVSPHQISGRFSELKRDGLIRKQGTRQNASGNACGVYVVVRRGA